MPNAPVQRRAAQRIVRWNRSLGGETQTMLVSRPGVWFSITGSWLELLRRELGGCFTGFQPPRQNVLDCPISEPD